MKLTPTIRATGWDMTDPRMRVGLKHMLRRFNTRLEDSLPKVYPALVTFVLSGAGTKVHATIEGYKDPSLVLTELLVQFETAIPVNAEHKASADASQARVQLRDEQDQAYQASLQQDRAREAAKRADDEKVAAAQRVVEDTAAAERRAEQLIADNQAAAQARVPAEPDAAATDTITIRFQTRAVRLNRKFSPEHTVQALIDFVHGEGFPPSTHLLATARSVSPRLPLPPSPPVSC